MDYERVRALLNKREDIDKELTDIFTGSKDRKPQRCGKCGQEGHNARNCTEPQT